MLLTRIGVLECFRISVTALPFMAAPCLNILLRAWVTDRLYQYVVSPNAVHPEQFLVGLCIVFLQDR